MPLIAGIAFLLCFVQSGSCVDNRCVEISICQFVYVPAGCGGGCANALVNWAPNLLAFTALVAQFSG